ncbi:hypothetical protein [Streptomyces sp. NPDC057509]
MRTTVNDVNGDNRRPPWWLTNWFWLGTGGVIVYLMTLLFQSLGWYPS